MLAYVNLLLLTIAAGLTVAAAAQYALAEKKADELRKKLGVS